MSFFDTSHLVGIPGSAGPAVSLGEMISQGFQQQFRVDSARALDDELRNRWLESLQAAQISRAEQTDPFDPYAYRAFAQHVQGRPIDVMDANRPLFGEYDPTTRIRGMIEANEQIRALNNPEIKTFEQILEEVSVMQRGVEERTASMSERASPTANILGSLIGAIGGSFTTRDPLNLITLPVGGGGRSVALRIASEMGVAGAVTAATEYSEVQPAREIAGLPERSPLLNIAAATIGAGVIRGGFEGIGAGLRSLRSRAEPDFNLDVRDAQLQQMFAANDASPRARAGASILDDAIVFERSNPYGDGQVAGFRWQAELDATARALNGEETAPIDLPPLPSEFIDRQLSFQSVKETAPDLWNELDAARTRLNELDNRITEVSARELTIPDAVRLVDEEAAAKLDQLSQVVNDLAVPEPVRAAADMEAQAVILRVGQDKIMKAVATADTEAKFEVKNLRASRKAANKKYRTAYAKVEREAERLELAEAAKRSIAQAESIDVLGPTITTEPMTGPMTRRDFVEAHTARVEEADAAIPERADAVNELEVDLETGTVDIGTKTPVSVDFKVPFEDGELTVRQILDDLAEDARLEEAVKGCAI